MSLEKISYYTLAINKYFMEVIEFLFIMEGPNLGFPTGGEKVTFRLARRLKERGFNSGILFINDPSVIIAKWLKDKELQNKYSIPKINKPALIIRKIISGKLFINKIKLWRKLRKIHYTVDIEDLEKVKVIFKNQYKKYKIKRAIFVPWQVYFLAPYVNAEFKYGMVFHSEDHPAYAGIYSKLASSAYTIQNIKKIVINKYEYARFGKEKPIKIIEAPLAEEIKNFKLIAPIKERKNTIVLVLRGGKDKGAKYAIEAARIIKEKLPNVQILSFGNYDGNVPDFINHRGFVDEEDLVKIMNGSKIVILPSIIEGLSMIGIEAMKCGAVLISTYNRGVEEYVINGKNGLLVKPKDVKALADAAIKLLKNDKLRTTLAKRGTKVADKFNEKRKVDMFLNKILEYEYSISNTHN